MASDVASLRDRIEELRRRRERISEATDREYEAIKELSLSPEPDVLHSDDRKASSLSLAPPVTDVEVPPSASEGRSNKVQCYFREVQTDPLPDPPPAAAVVIDRPQVSLSLDDGSRREVDVWDDTLSAEPQTLDDRVGAAEYNKAFWSQPFDKVFPIALDWSGHRVAVAARPLGAEMIGCVRVYDVNNLEGVDNMRVAGHPSTVQAVPDTSDLFVVGGMTGQVSVYDLRVGLDPVMGSKRSGQSHYWQIVSVMFTTRSQLRTIDVDGVILDWNLAKLGETKETVDDRVSGGRVTAACLDQCGEMIVGFETGLAAKKQAPAQMSEIRKYEGPVTAVDCRDSRLAVSALDGIVDVWSRDVHIKRIESLADSFVGCCWKPARSPTLSVFDSKENVVLYDIDAGTETKFTVDGVQVCSGFSADGSILCIGTVKNKKGGLHFVKCQNE